MKNLYVVWDLYDNIIMGNVKIPISKIGGITDAIGVFPVFSNKKKAVKFAKGKTVVKLEIVKGE